MTDSIREGTKRVEGRRPSRPVEKFLFGPSERKNYQLRKEQRAEREIKAFETIGTSLARIAELLEKGITVRK